MKKLTTIATVLALFVASVSCKKDSIGDGPVTTTTRNVSNYTAVDLQMNGNVYFTPAAEWKMEITAKQSLHGIIETNVVNNKLVIRYNNGRTYDEDASLRINISGPLVNTLMTQSSGNIYAMGDMAATQLFFHVGGSGSIVLRDINAGYVETAVYGSGNVSANGGAVQDEKLTTAASGDIDLTKVAAKKVLAFTKGSGNISVKVTDQLEARIDGSGSIYFNGYPQVTTHINGSGKLIRF